MDTETVCSASDEYSLTTIDGTITSDDLAKLKRLKIQESIITAQLQKCNLDLDDIVGVPDHNLVWKTYSVKVKNNINEIKNLFEDIKIATSDSEDNIKNINIEEIKKDILNLNSKVKSLEDYINTELTLLQSEEKDLLNQVTEGSIQKVHVKRKLKGHSKQYNEVVPSPVRVLINSPLKCKEVQQFQAFMSKSKNRYGGWNEYNHNIFLRIWNKFYATDDIANLENNMKKINCDQLLPQFKNEVYEKIPGIELEEILLHSKWYSELCYLKRLQQAALDKWKDNKMKIRGRQRKIENNKDVVQKSNKEKLCRKQIEPYQNEKRIFKGNLKEHEFDRSYTSFDISNTSSESWVQMNDELFNMDLKISNTNSAGPINLKLKSSTFAIPTEQWINRCNGSGAHKPILCLNSNIENIDKLCIPNWRLSLCKSGAKEC